MIHIPMECQIKQITLAEGSHVVKAIKKNKSTGSDGIVDELIKYGGKPMCEMLLILLNLVWNNDHVPSYWGRALQLVCLRKGGGKTLVIQGYNFVESGR